MQTLQTRHLRQTRVGQAYGRISNWLRGWFAFCSSKLLFRDFIYSLLDFIYLFLERGREREKGRHQCVVASRASNLGRCPDWESNQQLFGLRAGTQPTLPCQPGCNQVSSTRTLWSHAALCRTAPAPAPGLVWKAARPVSGAPAEREGGTGERAPLGSKEETQSRPLSCDPSATQKARSRSPQNPSGQQWEKQQAPQQRREDSHGSSSRVSVKTGVLT